MSQFAKKCGNVLTQLDMYGQPVTVLYDGSDVFKTKLGALVSIATYALMIFNLAQLSISFLNGSKQHESVQEQIFDRYSAGNFTIRDYRLNMTTF